MRNIKPVSSSLLIAPLGSQVADHLLPLSTPLVCRVLNAVLSVSQVGVGGLDAERHAALQTPGTAASPLPTWWRGWRRTLQGRRRCSRWLPRRRPRCCRCCACRTAARCRSRLVCLLALMGTHTTVCHQMAGVTAWAAVSNKRARRTGMRPHEPCPLNE